MIKKISLGILVGVILLSGVFMYLRSTTKKHSPEAHVQLKQNGFELDIHYCRPYKKNRIIFGDEATGALQPYGQYWRAGANEATTFETKSDVWIQHQLLPAGKYTLYVIPYAKNWTIAFNREFDRWGATPPDVNDDVLRVETTCQEKLHLTEQLEMNLTTKDSATVLFSIAWDNVTVEVPITLKK